MLLREVWSATTTALNDPDGLAAATAGAIIHCDASMRTVDWGYLGAYRKAAGWQAVGFTTTPATAGRMMAFWDWAEVEHTPAHEMSWALYRVAHGAIRLVS